MLLNDYFYYKNDKDIIYEIVSKKGDDVLLKGINYRRIITAKKEDIVKVSNEEMKQLSENDRKYYNNVIAKTRGNKNNKYILGTVLHIDADEEYLQKSVKLYKEIGIYCYPILCKETDIVNKVISFPDNFIPDVIVITGHDYYSGNSKKDLNSYTNSKYYIDAVKSVKRKFNNSIIIAGACQSNFESLIANGAHFASSPKRINVHVYDPAIIAINVCTTSFKNIVNFDKMEKNIINLHDAFGGVEVYGKMRMLY